MKKIVLLSVVAIMANLLTAQTRQQNKLNNLILKTEHQKLLSQRIVKDYLAIGLSINDTEYKKNIDLSMAEFDNNCFDFENGIVDEEIIEKVDAAENVWEEFRLIAIRDGSKTNAFELLKTKDLLLNYFNDIAASLKTKTNTENNVMELEIRRAQLAQERIAVYYLSISSFGEHGVFMRELNHDTKEFQRMLNNFDTHFDTNPVAQSKIRDIRFRWEQMKTKIGRIGNNKFYNKELLEDVEYISLLLNEIPTNTDTEIVNTKIASHKIVEN